MVEASETADETAVPLSRLGNGFVVDAVVNDGQRVRLLVDTGATLTIIRPGALSRAGVGPGAFVRETTLETAGGRVGARVYRLDSLRLGPEVVSNIVVGSVEIPGLGAIDGLLGMNVLGRFRFSIDQARQRMLLAR